MAERGKRAWSLLNKLPADRTVLGAEVGVLVGAFSRALFDRHRLLQLTLVDNWAERPHGKDHTISNLLPYANRYTIMHMDSLAAAKLIADATFDFVYIDADHSFEAVAADILAWAPKVRPGGLLCGHDFNHPDFPGVKRAVKQFLRRLPERDQKGRRTLQLGFDGNWFLTLPADPAQYLMVMSPSKPSEVPSPMTASASAVSQVNPTES